MSDDAKNAVNPLWIHKAFGEIWQKTPSEHPAKSSDVLCVVLPQDLICAYLGLRRKGLLINMKNCNVTFLPSGKSFVVQEGTNLLEAQRRFGLDPDAPCGGKGTCGKCVVRLTSQDNLQVKACQYIITGDITVEVSSKHKASLLEHGAKRSAPLAPPIRRVRVSIPKSVSGATSQWTLLNNALGGNCRIDLPSLQNFYVALEKNGREANVVLLEDQVLDVIPSDGRIFAVAFDIGTTSLVCYLLNLDTGEQVDVCSSINPQAQFGADVISRMEYARDNGVEPLQNAIVGAMNRLISDITGVNNISRDEVFLAAAVGNTCMYHLFLGILPTAMMAVPYSPVTGESLVMPAGGPGLEINPRGRVLLLPNIAGFVGADTVGVLLSTDLPSSDEMTLAIDIGTNGELVLGNKHKMLACSTAAGPAFEGAKITCGMRGAEGAIDHAHIENGSISYTVIGGGRPIGICGSGLIDIIACLIELGIVSKRGQIATPERTYVLASAEDSGDGKPVYITQQDIREVQLAKGALSAGINMLASTLGITTADIKRVLIAGAFGNYMDAHSACVIGLMPKELESRVIPVGNAAGEGAKLAALNYDLFLESSAIAKNTEFLELASDPGFQRSFMMATYFDI